MTIRPLILLAAALLAGCANPDAGRQQSHQTAPGEFTYSTIADESASPDDPAAETRRLGEVADYVRTNKLCPAGYDIVRRFVTIDIDPVATVYTIDYHGKCK